MSTKPNWVVGLKTVIRIRDQATVKQFNVSHIIRQSMRGHKYQFNFYRQSFILSFIFYDAHDQPVKV